MTPKEMIGDLKDPRNQKNQKYPFETLVIAAVCAVMAGEDSFTGIAEYVENNVDRLSEFINFPENKTPSHDLFRWIFELLDPNILNNWLFDLTNKLIENDERFEKNELSHIGIDGKTIRNSKDKLHIVHAFCTKNRLLLLQEKVDEKSNEITAIPKLLEALDLEGTVITIDAMGCQREICKQIIEKNGDYIIAVKENQKKLFGDIKEEFILREDSNEITNFTHYDKGHGRLETRVCSVIIPDHWLLDEHKWPGLKMIVRVLNKTEKKGKISEEERFFISSLQKPVDIILQIIRDHWRIENSLHYILDVTFNEDKACVRCENAAYNLSILRKLAMNILQNAKTEKQSMKSMIRKCSNPIVAEKFLIKFYHS